MTSPLILGSFLLLAVPGATPASEQAAQKLWKYPCDVYLGIGCLRLPQGMILSYHVPADFRIYELSKNGQSVVTIYVGFSPQDPPKGQATKVSHPMAKIEGYVSNDQFEVFIRPKEKLSFTMHLVGAVNEFSAPVIAELLAGFRMCKRSESVIDCPVDEELGLKLSSLAAWDPK